MLVMKSYICNRNFIAQVHKNRRGARVVMEQIANLSTRKCCPGSNPGLSANKLNTGCSVARLSRRVWDAEVAGSNPATPTFYLFNF